MIIICFKTGNIFFYNFCENFIIIGLKNWEILKSVYSRNNFLIVKVEKLEINKLEIFWIKSI